jgi:hypothetical protein
LAQVRYHAAELVKGLASAAADNLTAGMTEEEGVAILFGVNNTQPPDLINAALCEAVMMLARQEEVRRAASAV